MTNHIFLHKRAYIFIIALIVASLIVIIPVYAVPNANSPWQPTNNDCGQPVNDGAEFTNARKEGMTHCFQTLGSLQGSNHSEEFATDEVVIKYRNDAKHFRVIKLPQGISVKEAVNTYSKYPTIEYAEPNYIAYAFFTPNDPYYGFQWHMDNAVYGGIHTGTAWDQSSGSGTIVAVVDTGVAYENYKDKRQYYKAPDLASTCFVAGYDFVNNDAHANDDNSHGTHVAGTIAQSTNNAIGVAGVGFSSCIMPVKVLNKNGSGTHTQIAKGIRFAADNGAKVINLSLGGSTGSQTLQDAVAYAHSKGVTIVAAAGNSNSSLVSYPAAYNNYVIAVGATRYDETRAPYSNYGASLDIVAPGGDTNVDQNGDGYADGVLQNTFNPLTKNTADFGYWFFQGTSMASPHVAGVAALVISKGIASAPNDVRTVLQSTAEEKGAAGWDSIYGWGLLDAAAAVNYTPAP